jgi:photosystem II stability/assembly factor-like uncharacterized protein
VGRPGPEYHCPVSGALPPLSLLLMLLLIAAPAQAHHAAPDTTQVLLPADRATSLVLATNFGLITSDDGGGSWRWQCDQGLGAGGYRYQLAAAPGRRLFTLGMAGVAHSDDLGCSWSPGVTAGRPETTVFDFAADPADPARLLVLATGAGGSSVILESRDGGDSFGTPLYTAPAGEGLTSLVMASDPAVAYAVQVRGDGDGHPRLARTRDRGATWTIADPGVITTRGSLRIAGVDPADPARLYLRVAGEQREKLALSPDGGATVQVVLELSGTVVAFIRLASGTLLVDAAEAEGRLYRSHDGGRSWAPLPASLGARGFAERGGQLYAATDNASAGFALAVSGDEGDSWRPVMRFSDVSALAACPAAAPACHEACVQTASRGVVPGTLCAAGPDAGSAADPGGAPSAAGCGCQVPAARPMAAVPTLLPPSLLLALLLRRRRPPMH